MMPRGLPTTAISLRRLTRPKHRHCVIEAQPAVINGVIARLLATLISDGFFLLIQSKGILTGFAAG
jgi:hypothetical protein